MPPKYVIGQKVIVTPVKNQQLSVRDADIETYAGQSGKVVDYHWISISKGEILYLYTVQIGAGDKELVLHEDEVEPYIE